MKPSGCSDDDREEKKLEYGSTSCDFETELNDPLPSTDISSDEHRRIETAWEQSNNDQRHFRMESIWAQVEADYARRNSQTRSPIMDDTHHVSPLMARSDFAEDGKNRAGYKPDEQLNKNNKISSVSLIQQSTKPSLIQRYRIFLQKHEPSLDILERVMERFVFYRYLFNHDHNGMKIELYYAAWNIVRWINDVVLVGWGEGMGTTIGTRHEWLDTSETTPTSERKTFQDWALSRMYIVVPVLRAILTATTCVYPALEAWARKPISPRSNHGIPLPCNETHQQPEWMFATTSDLPPKTRRMQWEVSQSRAADLSYGVERIRFVSRLALLSISWWARHRRELKTKENLAAAPSLMRRGGELDPCEVLLPLTAANKAAAVMQYKGKRTGRRSVSTSSALNATAPTKSNGPCFLVYLRQLISCKRNILYFHTVGELLHILRPLYWARSESIEWRQRASSSNHGRNSSFSFSLWKAWILSLLMDMISDELLDISTGCNAYQAPVRTGKWPSMLSRSSGRNAPTSPVSPLVQSEQEELTWRRSRRSIYLLRSPIYSTITVRIMTAVARVVSKIPSFGLGRWATEYILDMLSYWNEHRFMLE